MRRHMLARYARHILATYKSARLIILIRRHLHMPICNAYERLQMLPPPTRNSHRYHAPATILFEDDEAPHDTRRIADGIIVMTRYAMSALRDDDMTR